MKMKSIVMGTKTARVPIVQGGMGVGVSLSGLAGAVAANGGIGIISTAQIGFLEEGFDKNPAECNRQAIKKHVRMAKEQVVDGLVGVNVMVALKDYEQHVRAAVEAGADIIISGAGLPVDLPGFVEGSDTKIAPIVSSEKAANVILALWDRKFHRTADILVIEGPKAGGHLGFTREQLADIGALDYNTEIQKIIAAARSYGQKYGVYIPVMVAGGITDRNDVERVLALGADGVQVASRFVATMECDASETYKQAYIAAKETDVTIIQSPVGMPGRALNNRFIQRIRNEKESVKKCYQCLAHCKPAEIPYCITKALIDAVLGDVENGLVFCGADVGKIHQMTTVKDLMEELAV